MNDKVKLLELAYKRMVSNRDFTAYFLDQYLNIEQTNIETLIIMLGCDLENYYKLGLCKVPSLTGNSYLTQLNSISTYIGISSMTLNKIFKKVGPLIELRNNPNETSILMAARDMKKK